MVALGGVICHLLLIPPWVFCTVLPCVATAMLLQRAQLALLLAQLVLSTLAYQKPQTGVPVALVSSAISYAMYLGGDTAGFAGSFIYSAMQWVNWGVTFPYVPAFTRLIFGLDMSSYYKKCELRGALDRMGRSRTLYLFRPLQNCGSGTVSEEDAGRAVIPVHKGGQFLGSEDERVLEGPI